MAAAKKRAKAKPQVGLVGRLLNPLAGSGRSMFVVITLLALPIIGVYLAWSKYGPVIIGQPRFVLDAGSLEITSQPSWIHVDVKSEVVRDGSLAGMSILDPELTRKVVRAFELHTWVAKVVWVGKRPGVDAPRVIVKLRYREPAVMVKTKQGFWPVDTDGFLLPPNEFSPSQTHSYLRVLAGESQPAGPVGTLFGDDGIFGAAKIAAVFRESWRQIGLEWIKVEKNRLRNLDPNVEPTYLLFPIGNSPVSTANTGLPNTGSPNTGSPNTGSQWASNSRDQKFHVEVRWGRAPGREHSGEATVAEKVARLKRFVEENGPLDKQPSSVILDLRPAAGISIQHPTPLR